MKTGESHSFEHQLEVGASTYSYESRIVSTNNREILAIVRDVTERRKAQERIVQLAYHDTLTGLLNQHSFKENLTRALEQAKRHKRLMAVLLLDIDRFKRINDTFGPNMGDLLLKGIADRLDSCIRKSDFMARSCEPSRESDIAARLGGDEFMILLSQITHHRDAAKVSRRVLDVLSQPFHLAGHELFVTASIGISLFPHDGEDVDNLLKNADAAMYHVKDKGRNDFQFYAQAMNSSALERLSLENRLRKALEREEFTLYYQPQVDIRSGRIVGAEALIRWRPPGAAMVPPGEFIPLAEETGLIVPISEWVLSMACLQNKAWQHSGLGPVRVTVNLSGLQFTQKNLFEVINRATANAELDPKFLELEITETCLMQNASSTVETLKKLKAAGFRIAVDDFGTGYSSLSYLKRFPLDVLKIDRSFVSNMTTDSDDAAIATAIIAMARSLNLKVIAEGVETEEQLDFLKIRECDEIQGYLFSPPVPAERFEELLRNGPCNCTRAEMIAAS